MMYIIIECDFSLQPTDSPPTLGYIIYKYKRQPTLQARSNFGLWYTPCILALILQL